MSDKDMFVCDFCGKETTKVGARLLKVQGRSCPESDGGHEWTRMRPGAYR